MREESEEAARHEALYKAAESRAKGGKRIGPLPSLVADSRELPGDGCLLEAAHMELARRSVRQRYLPAEFVTDQSWMILLDLFVCELEMQPINTSDAPPRWRLSNCTAARHIAALIETSLVSRVRDEMAHDPAALRLTDIGKLYVRRILSLSNSPQASCS